MREHRPNHLARQRTLIKIFFKVMLIPMLSQFQSFEWKAPPDFIYKIVKIKRLESKKQEDVIMAERSRGQNLN